MRRGTPRAWQRGTRVRAVEVRDDEAKEQRLAANRVAVMLGYCPSCGEHVDVEHGKPHDAWCPDVKREAS